MNLLWLTLYSLTELWGGEVGFKYCGNYLKDKNCFLNALNLINI